jgi:hypothetical protein
MTKFTDKQQFKTGKEVEAYLDDYFSRRGWQIERTTDHEERGLCLGDRHYRQPGMHLYVEYKSGIQTFYTGNVFLETVSVDTENKPGWVYTCKADYIFYAALLNGEILIMLPNKLRAEIEALKRRFRTVKTSKGQNETYNTHGVIVPLEYAEKHLTAKIIFLERAA